MKPGKHRQNDAAEQPETAVPPPPPGEDARQDSGKLKENREKLGVDDEHRTPDMKEHHRGTFP